MAEIVGDVGLLCPPAMCRRSATPLARIVDDDDLHGELNRRGPERAAQFSWSSSAARHAEVYREAIERYG